MPTNRDLRQWMQAYHEMVGEAVERPHWWELIDEPDTRFTLWIQMLKANGLKD